MLFVPSEEPYHQRKVTLLNGPHTVLAPVSWLSGVNIVRDACQHEVLEKYIHKVMFEELLETLNLPKEELVIHIRRGKETVIPQGSTEILAGDVLVMYCSEKTA